VPENEGVRKVRTVREDGAGRDMGSAAPAGGALSGLLVADFSRVLAGPLATMLMADLGATVIKVEQPGRGDDTRSWGPPFRDGVATYYLSVNRNKRSVEIDLSTAHGLAAARTLAQRADVLVENFRPGRLGSFGLDYESLHAANPGLVYCSISGFGHEAGADLAGYDLVAQAVGGLMSLTGPAEGSGTKAGVPVADVLTGLYAAIGILSALNARRDSGLGQHVRVSLLSSVLASLVNHAVAYLNTGNVPRAMGNRHPSVVPYEPLPTADRPLVVAAANDRQFAALCEALGVAALARDPRFADNARRVEHRDELLDVLTQRLAERPAAEWWDRLTAAGVPSGPVNDVGEAFELARRLGLSPSVSLANGAGTVEQVSNPLLFSETPVSYRSPPPSLGTDTSEVLAWLEGPDPAVPDGWSG
jgi:crotonobetainyl-CoA:carnitine CoA-transferase CaiB-like acyl-CoA transferase